jgi:hypothetical protein
MNTLALSSSTVVSAPWWKSNIHRLMLSRRFQTKILALLSALLVLTSCNGCMTQSTIRLAERQVRTNEQDEKVETRPARPGYYALMPLAVAADIVLVPGYLFVFALFSAAGPKC